ELEGQCDESDLAEVKIIPDFQDRIERRQQGLQHIIEQMTETERHKHRKGGFLAIIHAGCSSLITHGRNSSKARLRYLRPLTLFGKPLASMTSEGSYPAWIRACFFFPALNLITPLGLTWVASSTASSSPAFSSLTRIPP